MEFEDARRKVEAGQVLELIAPHPINQVLPSLVFWVLCLVLGIAAAAQGFWPGWLLVAVAAPLAVHWIDMMRSRITKLTIVDTGFIVQDRSGSDAYFWEDVEKIGLRRMRVNLIDRNRTVVYVRLKARAAQQITQSRANILGRTLYLGNAFTFSAIRVAELMRLSRRRALRYLG